MSATLKQRKGTRQGDLTLPYISQGLRGGIGLTKTELLWAQYRSLGDALRAGNGTGMLWVLSHMAKALEEERNDAEKR